MLKYYVTYNYTDNNNRFSGGFGWCILEVDEECDPQIDTEKFILKTVERIKIYNKEKTDRNINPVILNYKIAH